VSGLRDCMGALEAQHESETESSHAQCKEGARGRFNQHRARGPRIEEALAFYGASLSSAARQER